MMRPALSSTCAALALAALLACTPTADTADVTPAPTAPTDLAAPASASGPAAPNTTDTLSTAPATPAPTTTATLAPTTAEIAVGAAVYARTCAMCHGPAGQGTAMGVTLAVKDAAKVKEKVAKGMLKPDDKMPPLGAAMTAEELDHVASYVAAGLPQ
jgi:mono/diheme cytochrome c family protein